MSNADSLDEPDPGVYTLNCGNADAHAVVTPAGTTGLIDADRGQVVEELNELFGRTSDETDTVTIDFSYTTHIHEDHVFGIQKLKDAGYSIEEAYRPPKARFDIGVDEGVNSDVLNDYVAALSEHGIAPDEIKEVTTGDEIFREDDATLTALSPPATSEPIEFDHPITGESCTYGCEKANPNSAACRYDDPDNSYLFMGDIENRPDHDAEAWLIKQHQEKTINLDADVAVLGHHGSNNASDRPLLETVDQDWTVISADGNNHPATETLSNLQATNDGGVSVTDSHGRIAFTDGLPPTSENVDAPTEPWQIDQEIHGSAWSEIAGQKQDEINELETENEEKDETIEHLETENEQFKAEKQAPESSSTSGSRLFSRLPVFGNGSAKTPDDTKDDHETTTKRNISETDTTTSKEFDEREGRGTDTEIKDWDEEPASITGSPGANQPSSSLPDWDEEPAGSNSGPETEANQHKPTTPEPIERDDDDSPTDHEAVEPTTIQALSADDIRTTFNNGNIYLEFGPNQSEIDSTTVQVSADESISFSEEDGNKTLTLDEAESNATIRASSDDDMSVSSDGGDIHMDLGSGNLHISPRTDKCGMRRTNNGDLALGLDDDRAPDITDDRKRETDTGRVKTANGDPETANDNQERDTAHDNRANGGLSR